MLERVRDDPEFLYREFLHPDVVWEDLQRDSPTRGSYPGIDGVRKFFRGWAEAWGDWRWEIRELIDAGDDVIAVVHDSLTGRQSGLPIEFDHALVYTLADGRCVRVRSFDTKDEALRAAGLEPTV